jgi:hypothetical protein
MFADAGFAGLPEWVWIIVVVLVVLAAILVILGRR